MPGRFFLQAGVVCLWLLPLLLMPAGVTAAPNVVVTIKPVHSLVAGVMAGGAEPLLLIGGAGTPHHYSLRPSDARALARADLVVRVGTDFETFLNRPLASLAGEARIVSLDEMPGIILLPARAGGVWEEHAHDGEEEHGAGADHREFNLHLWLDPQNARAIVAELVRILSAEDPAGSDRYQANGAALDQRLIALDQSLARQLGPVAEKPYVVFHDAYPYLEERYHLQAVGSITIDPERSVGARRLKDIRKKIVRSGARCVFSEPQFEPKLVSLLIEGTGAGKGILDPLGVDLPSGPDAYFSLLNGLGESLRRCLENGK